MSKTAHPSPSSARNNRMAVVWPARATPVHIVDTSQMLIIPPFCTADTPPGGLSAKWRAAPVGVGLAFPLQAFPPMPG